MAHIPTHALPAGHHEPAQRYQRRRRRRGHTAARSHVVPAPLPHTGENDIVCTWLAGLFVCSFMVCSAAAGLLRSWHVPCVLAPWPSVAATGGAASGVRWHARTAGGRSLSPGECVRASLQI